MRKSGGVGRGRGAVWQSGGDLPSRIWVIHELALIAWTWLTNDYLRHKRVTWRFN